MEYARRRMADWPAPTDEQCVRLRYLLGLNEPPGRAEARHREAPQ